LICAGPAALQHPPFANKQANSRITGVGWRGVAEEIIRRVINGDWTSTRHCAPAVVRILTNRVVGGGSRVNAIAPQG